MLSDRFVGGNKGAMENWKIKYIDRKFNNVYPNPVTEQLVLLDEA